MTLLEHIRLQENTTGKSEDPLKEVNSNAAMGVEQAWLLTEESEMLQHNHFQRPTICIVQTYEIALANQVLLVHL